MAAPTEQEENNRHFNWIHVLAPTCHEEVHNIISLVSVCVSVVFKLVARWWDYVRLYSFNSWAFFLASARTWYINGKIEEKEGEEEEEERGKKTFGLARQTKRRSSRVFVCVFVFAYDRDVCLPIVASSRVWFFALLVTLRRENPIV